MSPATAVDPCLCPLCGQPNQCAMTQQQPGEVKVPCWCAREQFNAELLQQVPEPLKDKACICRACVQASRAVV
jgi:hypothetical protein